MNLALLAAQATDSGTKMEIGDAALVAVVGYGVVFLGIVMLMVILYITGSIFKKRDAKAAEAKTETKAAPAPDKDAPAAPGSAGHVKLNGIDEKDAAMIIAIVADKMQTPLNELRFISIKEVE